MYNSMKTTTQAGWSGPIKDFVEEDRLIVRKDRNKGKEGFDPAYA